MPIKKERYEKERHPRRIKQSAPNVYIMNQQIYNATYGRSRLYFNSVVVSCSPFSVSKTKREQSNDIFHRISCDILDSNHTIDHHSIVC